MSAVKPRSGQGTPFDQLVARREAGTPLPPLTAVPESADTRPASEVAESLGNLAAIANAEHCNVRDAHRDMIQHAITAGDALLRAQSLVDGGWIDWLKTNVQINISTVYRYMRVAEHREIVLASGADSIYRAMQALADVPRRGHGPRRYSDADKADWLKLADEIGVKPAARAVGVSPSTMHKWTSPNSPARGQTRQSREITGDRIERVATWLVARFGGFEYPERVNAEVRVDASKLLAVVFEIEAAA